MNHLIYFLPNNPMSPAIGIEISEQCAADIAFMKEFWKTKKGIKPLTRFATAMVIELTFAEAVQRARQSMEQKKKV